MRKVGRNDPCHCGSGVKYKYCCLQKDQEEAAESSAPESNATTSSQTFPSTESSMESSTESQTPSPAEEAYKRFEAAEYEDRQALVEEIIGDSDRMDAENAFHMINELAPLAIDRGEADWALHVITRLEDEQPDTYAAELPHLLMNHLEAAAAAGRVEEVVAERVDALETMATADIDQFHPCIELIAYHASPAPVAEATDNALEAVRADSNIMPHGKDHFCNEAVQYNLLAEYEQHGAVDLQDPDLQSLLNRIDDPNWGELDFEFLEQFAARLSGPNDRSWQVEDDPVENIDWLATDFMCTVHEQSDIPLGRGHLAQKTIVECYGRRHEQNPSLDTDRLLQLDQKAVRAQLNEIGSFMSSHPHQRAAFFSLLPAWLQFLEERALLSAAKADTVYQNLRPLRRKVVKSLDNFSSDPTLARDVEAAWE